MIKHLLSILALVSTVSFTVFFKVILVLNIIMIDKVHDSNYEPVVIKGADFWGLKAIMLLVRHRVTTGLNTILLTNNSTGFWGLQMDN